MGNMATALFDRLDDAYNAVQECTQAGIDHHDISLIARDLRVSEDLQPELNRPLDSESLGKNASAGAAIGAGAGLLAGLSAIVLPVIGPAVAFGAAATGAVIGAGASTMITAIDRASTTEEESAFYREALRRGGAVVTIQTTDEALLNKATDILNRHHAVDTEQRMAQWKQEGWDGHNSDSSQYESSPDNPVRRRPGDMMAA